jgi:hypothetical protein
MVSRRTWFMAIVLVSLGLVATPIPASANAEPEDLIVCTDPEGGATVEFEPAIDQTKRTVRTTTTDGKVSGCTGSDTGITRATFRTTETATVGLTASCSEVGGSASGSIEVTWYKNDEEVGTSTITLIADSANLAEGKDLLTGHVKEGTPQVFNGGWLTGQAELDDSGNQAFDKCVGADKEPIASLKLVITELKIVQK